MKPSIVSVSAKFAALALTALAVGCASNSNVRSNAVDAVSESKRTRDLPFDFERIAQVEAVARHNGTRVVWVNMPRKRVGSTD